MLTALLVLLRSIGLLCRGHRAVALENLALRQQLAALTRTIKRAQFRHALERRIQNNRSLERGLHHRYERRAA